MEKKRTNSDENNLVIGYKDNVKFLFAIMYFISLLVSIFISYKSDIFINWSTFTFSDSIKLLTSIGLSFIIPGYAIISIISTGSNLEKIPKLLSGYFASIIITGLSAYITVAFGFAVSNNRNIVLAIYAIILILYVTINRDKLFKKSLLTSSYCSGIKSSLISLRMNVIVLMVFLSLLSMIIILTYYIFNGTIIGDQWYHHGRSLQFINGSFRDIDAIVSDYYPPLFSGILSEFIVLSGIPSVNAFLSINLLMILPVLSFYYFMRMWVPIKAKKASLIATTLFMLASGFGWIYLIQLGMSDPIHSASSILEIFRIATLKAFDLNLANTFFATPHPSPHGIIALPAGFLLLSLLKINIIVKLKTILIFLVAVVGIMSHDEFYLFILISSFLLLIYNINKAHFIYASLLSSITFVLLVDLLLPIKYFTVIEISGMPLIYLSIGFVLVMWLLYSLKISRLFSQARTRINFKAVGGKRARFILAATLISAVFYLYFFTFVVWSNLSVEEVAIQTDNYGQRDIPWYLFPMKLGIVGFIGLLFIVSYLFKKFEREIFVFAIIAIFAFLAAPYYDEYRFGKYIMVGMIGFASLLLYKFILYLQKLRMNILVGSIFIGIVITAAALSLLIYSGFKELLLDNPGYRLIPGENNRNFPTGSEIKMFTILKDNIVNTKRDNIALLNSEYGNGLLSEKIMGFVGIPFSKIYHNPLILNATSLYSFYELLNRDDVRYIVIGNEDLEKSVKYTKPVKFAINNFPRLYQDKDYLILKVPELTEPINNPDVAVIIGAGYKYSYPQHILQYNITSNGLNIMEGMQIKKNGNLIISNNSTNPTIARSPLEDKEINFIETEFKIIQENIPDHKTEIKWDKDSSLFQQESSAKNANNNVGIRWSDEHSEYSLLLTSKGLQLSFKSINGTQKTSVIRSQEILKENGISYNIKILSLKREIVVLVNDIPRMEIEREEGYHANNIISKIEVLAHGNVAEFNPINVKQVSNLDELYYDSLENIHYIISSLAMSQYSYGVSLVPDLSEFSKPILLPVDPTNMSATNFNAYLEYVKNGGRLIVFHSGNDVDGIFGRYLSINRSELYSNLTSIVKPFNNKEINVNMTAIGKTWMPNLPVNKELTVVSYYGNKADDNISPFTVEKLFPKGGKIVYVNSAELFQSISEHKSKFLKLANFTDFLNLDDDRSVSKKPDKLNSFHQFTPIEKFIGLMELDGKIKIKSNSLFAYDEQNKHGNLNLRVDKLVLLNQTKKIEFDNITIEQLRFYGKYSAEISSTGFVRVPSSNSFYDYIDFHIPAKPGSKIKVNPESGGGVMITLINNSKKVDFDFTGDFEMNIEKIPKESSNASVNFLVKKPEIKFTGNAIVDTPDFSNFALSGNRFLKVNGTISTTFDHVDDYNERNNNSVESRYVSYLDGLNITGATNPGNEKFRIMGDISYRAKNHDLLIPLQQVFFSIQNMILIICFIVICFSISILVWSRKII